ncbi:MAG: hypothetical protein WBQ25_25790 [Nitrososphaeraceae archaeon]
MVVNLTSLLIGLVGVQTHLLPVIVIWAVTGFIISKPPAVKTRHTVKNTGRITDCLNRWY